MNSVGKAIQRTEIAIIDQNGALLPDSERGIVYVNTPSRFIGYISGKARCNMLYKDWLNTGDVGYIDNNGELHITGHIDDVIILDTHKIYSSDIEKIILDLTEISECVVVKSTRTVSLLAV